MKLMIVDDSSVMRKMLIEFCSPYSENIEECCNGLEAVKRYNTFKPDFVLMDIKMPIMNGIDALKKIKADHSEAKIIMITQYKDKELETKSMKSGAIAFFLKENLTDLDRILITKSKGG